MSARRALLTGGSGFIGACLARRLLADGYAVELLVRPGSSSWRLDEIRPHAGVSECDLRDEPAVRRLVGAARPDLVFHLAAHGAYSWQTDDRAIFESNVLGTLNLLQACSGLGFEALVHAGTSSEYGYKDHPPSEDEVAEPNSTYAVAKLAATMLCRNAAVQHGLHVVTLRLYSVYGPWEDPRRLMPTLVAHGLRGRLPPLVAPETARDFVHVEDVCDAFLAAATRGGNGEPAIYNVGSGTQTTLRSLVEVARDVMAIPAQPQWGSYEARRWDTGTWVSDPGRIQTELGWSARRMLPDGLRDFAAWLSAREELHGRYGMRDGGSLLAPT